MRADVVVIGAGLGGLAAAIALAGRGLAVVVVEASATSGGKAGEATVDGASFDTGPSLLTLPGVVSMVAESGGATMDDVVRLRRLDRAFRYVWKDGTELDVAHTLDDTLTNVISTFGQNAGDDLMSFLAYARRIWEAAAPTFVYGDAPTPARLMRTDLSTLARMRHIDPLRSMRSAIAAHVRSPQLRMLLERYATYNGSDPRRAPATLNCIAWVELGLGGWGVEGGVYALVRGLEALAMRLGVAFLFDCPVATITSDSAGVTGVRLADGRALTAPVVVGNADAAHVFADLLQPEHRRRPPGEPSTSGITAVFRRSRTVADTAAPHTVIFPHDYEQEFADLFDRRRVPQAPTIYACDQSAAHGRPGWEDATPLFAMINAPARQAGAAPEPPDAVERMRAQLVDAGLLAPGDELAWSRGAVALAEQFPGSRGAIYGAASNGPTAAFARPSNAVTRVPGLLLASGSAHPGGGMPLCMLSGLAAARQPAVDERVRRAR